MRTALWDRIGKMPASHFGHAYEVLAPPLGTDGKPDLDNRDAWLDRCEDIEIAADYQKSFARWRDSFPPSAKKQEMGTVSRLLIGHGNPSGADVGLTVHHTWGVPVLPGSALKGLLAHYVDVTYGDGDSSAPERREWRGPTWTDRRIREGDGAGAHFAGLFGAPEEDGAAGSARGGLVVFHDALYVPGSAGRPDRPYARDVLTVHQKSYYDSKGTEWPTDWDKPNPVGFITVRPKTRFQVVLTGEGAWPALAMTMLTDALKEWGVGGKTSAGYGRFAPA